MNIYERIDGSKYRNIWVVGDLHGCYTNLMNKLDTIGFDNEKDLLISVGDLVDRGAENVECLELITFPWFRAVRGNHEQMMIDGLSERGNVNHWLLNGGVKWFTEFGHLNRGDMLTSEQHRCHNEKKKFQRRV